MSNLLLSTLAMMGITFIIGFFVAAIIKIIANCADFFDFYNLHKEELHHLKKEHKLHQHVAVAEIPTGDKGNGYPEASKNLANKLRETVDGLKNQKRVTA